MWLTFVLHIKQEDTNTFLSWIEKLASGNIALTTNIISQQSRNVEEEARVSNYCFISLYMLVGLQRSPKVSRHLFSYYGNDEMKN